ncbi:endonuclease/exonuclease/phosphatase family protein [Streptomyces albireticuli]|nr:endonuclease/exonuclease/phosphatase family protein [Streptomyces albireticuli]MCD9166224.1 endonuclease/exonuclease/phosphatase family protein [Streptomyces albireticuli]MCD9196541.1 endonuclease/exonuclease/phosphatase family protein [Streptomyces albireticuli]
MADKAKFSVMAFNIEQLPKSVPWWTPGTEYRQDRVNNAETVILNNDADVVVLDEAFTSEAEALTNTDKIKNKYPYQTKLVGVQCSGDEWDSYSGDCSRSLVVISGGVKILSKFKITEKHQLTFDDSSKNSWDYWANKGAGLVKLDVNGTSAWLAGTHLQADEKTPEEDRKIRVKQITQLRTWATQKSGGAPIVVAGDFNVPYYEIDHNDQSAPKSEVSEEFKEAEKELGCALFPQASYPTFEKKYTYDMVKNPRAKLRLDKENTLAKYKNVLDYVGCIKGDAAAPAFPDLEGGKILDDYSVPSGEKGELKIPSDHYPLISWVEL